MPAEALSYVTPARQPICRPDCVSECDADWLKKYRGDLKTLDILALCEDRLAGGMSGDAHIIYCPWSDQHTSGDEYAYVWESDGEGFPGFCCNHNDSCPQVV